jgi:hypothetical protein
MSERGRRLELCREWGSAIDGQTFESWLAERVIALEVELEKAKDKYTALFNKTQSTAMHASAAEGNGCSDCAIDQEACPVCYRVWWNKRHPNTNIVAADDSVVFAANRRAETAEAQLDHIADFCGSFIRPNGPHTQEYAAACADIQDAINKQRRHPA